MIDNKRAATHPKHKNCIFEDKMKNDAETLAHETVHLLGISDHSDKDSHLIAPGKTRTGQFISKNEANKINKTDVLIPI